MNRRPVSSSNVASIGWEPQVEGADIGALEVEFKSGKIYRYADVPESEYEQLIGASSIGRHLSSNIIGVYDAQRV